MRLRATTGRRRIASEEATEARRAVNGLLFEKYTHPGFVNTTASIGTALVAAIAACVSERGVVGFVVRRIGCTRCHQTLQRRIS